MSYLTNNLGKNEQLKKEGKLTWWILLPNSLICIIAFFVSLGVYLIKTEVGIVFLIITLMGTVIMLTKPVIDRLTTEIIITDQRVISKSGWLNISVISTPLNKVNNINMKQSLLGKLLKYGNIEVTTATSEETDNHLVGFLKDPGDFRNILSEEIDIQDQSGIRKK